MVKAFFEMPLGAKLLLLGITLCVGASIFLFGFTKWQLVSLMVLLGLEIILCIVSYFYVENYQIKTSNVRVVEYKEYCKGIMECPFIFLCTITLCVVLISGALHIANRPEMLCVHMQCTSGNRG